MRHDYAAIVGPNRRSPVDDGPTVDIDIKISDH
jgi:hypothetical protein